MHATVVAGVLGLLSGLLAQSPVLQVPERPALVLLLREPVALEVEAVRGRWTRVVKSKVEVAPQEPGAWLQAEGETLVGGRDGLRFVVRAGGVRELTDHALRHLDDEERAKLRAHRASIEVACTSELAKAANRTDVYRLLGGVTAAVVARGVEVVGVGAADHGTFDPAPTPAELRKELLGEDPLAWLEPVMTSSLVVFTKKQAALDQKDLATRLGKELAVVFADGENAQAFVVVGDDTAIVKVGDDMAMLSWRPAAEGLKKTSAKYEDLRLRKAIEDHQALLHLAVHGAATEAAEAARRRLLARIAVGLWSDDFLMFSWHCNLALLPAGTEVPKQLRADDPVQAMLGEPLVPVVEATDAEAMQQAIAQARREWATAVAHHGTGGELSVKMAFPTRRQGTEHIWVTVTRIDGDVVHGTLANEPADLEGKKLGDAVSGKVAELSDWLFQRDGAMVGGFTVKVLRAQQARKAKQTAK